MVDPVKMLVLQSLVECTFAINSTAPGIVVIQDDQNIDNTTLVRNGDKGSVNITDLPAGKYNVRVYDRDPCVSLVMVHWFPLDLLLLHWLPVLLLLDLIAHLAHHQSFSSC